MVFKKITVGLQNETETDEHWMMFLETSIDVHCITNYYRWWKLSWQSIWFQVINYFKRILYIEKCKYLTFWKICFIPIRILISYQLCLKSLNEMFCYCLLKLFLNLYCIYICMYFHMTLQILGGKLCIIIVYVDIYSVCGDSLILFV